VGSPVREFCTPGSMAGLSGNRYSYATVSICLPFGSAHRERGMGMEYLWSCNVFLRII